MSIGIVLLLSYYASITVFLSCLDETENQGRECPLKIKLAFGLNMIFSPIFVLGSFRAVYMLPTVLCQVGHIYAHASCTCSCSALARAAPSSCWSLNRMTVASASGTGRWRLPR